MRTIAFSAILVFSFAFFPGVANGGEKVCSGECGNGNEYLVRETSGGGSYTVTYDASTGQLYLTINEYDPEKTCSSLGKGFC